MKTVKVKFTLNQIGPSEEIFELTYPDHYSREDFLSEASLDWIYEKVKTSYEILEDDSFNDELINLYYVGKLDEGGNESFLDLKNKLNQIAYMLGRIDYKNNTELTDKEILNKIYNY